MCLRIYKKPIVKETESEKTFYKIVTEWNDGCTTPYMGKKLDFGVEYADGDQEKFVFDRLPFGNFCEIGYGGYHLFVTKKDAENEIENLKGWHYVPRGALNYFVAKAIVPKGTKYVEGYYGDKESVVVKKVKYEKID